MSQNAKPSPRVARAYSLAPYVQAVGKLEVAEALRDFDETYQAQLDLERQHDAAAKAHDEAPEEERAELAPKLNHLGERLDVAVAAWGLAIDHLAKTLRGAVGGGA